MTILSKIKNVYFFISGAMLIFCVISNLILKSRIERLIIEKSKLEQTLDIQNQMIEHNKVEIETYKAQKPKIVEKIKTKYQTIKIKDDTCENELQTLKDTLNVFFKNN